MRTIGVTEMRQNVAAVLDSVIDDVEEVVVTRQGAEPVVIVGLREYNSMVETAHLLSSPANARHLRDSIAELDAGRGEAHDLADVDGDATTDAA